MELICTLILNWCDDQGTAESTPSQSFQRTLTRSTVMGRPKNLFLLVCPSKMTKEFWVHRPFYGQPFSTPIPATTAIGLQSC